MKKNIMLVLLGAILATTTIVIAENLNASNIDYKTTTVEEAIDDLYTKAKPDYTGTTTFTPTNTTQTILTNNKILKSDITINPIPTNYKALSTLENELSANDLLSGKKAYNSNGEVITGTGTNIVPSSKTLLWTNPSPSSSMASTTITLNSSIENFTHFLVIYKNYYTDTTTYENIFKVNPIRTDGYNSDGKYTIGGAGTSYLYSRGIYYITSTTLKIGGSYQAGGASSLNNSFLIPISIYGLNLSY